MSAQPITMPWSMTSSKYSSGWETRRHSSSQFRQLFRAAILPANARRRGSRTPMMRSTPGSNPELNARYSGSPMLSSSRLISSRSDMTSLPALPGALEAIVNDPQLKLDALILPGHVSTIIGMEPYRFLAEKYGVPGVITGFEPVDVLQGIAMIMRQLHEGRAEIEIAYARGVMPEGNPTALAAIDEVFETCTATWRGLGEIPGSGYRIRGEYAEFDAVERFRPQVEPTQDPKGCRCGDVLRGVMAPSECPLFRKVCTPENPVGPCMVSSEGSCAAYYRYY